jgi:hypothetical protein
MDNATKQVQVTHVPTCETITVNDAHISINMWDHECPVDGSISVGEGEECSWCGATEDK